MLYLPETAKAIRDRDHVLELFRENGTAFARLKKLGVGPQERLVSSSPQHAIDQTTARSDVRHREIRVGERSLTGPVRSGCVFELRIIQERADSTIDPLLFPFADYARFVKVVSLYGHEGSRRHVFDWKDYFHI